MRPEYLPRASISRSPSGADFGLIFAGLAYRPVCDVGVCAFVVLRVVWNIGAFAHLK